MAERMAGIWWYRLLFVSCAVFLAYIQLLPIDPGPGQLPGPDLLLVITLAWMIVRPALLPVWLVAFVFLLSDFLLMRPPGLWTALAILGCEFLRSRQVELRNAPFTIEWVLVAGVITAMTLAELVVLSLFVVPQPTFGLTMIRLIFTILAYPVIVLLAGRAIGLVKSSGTGETLGARR